MIAKVKDFSLELRSVNLKVTPARIAVLKLLESHDTPVDSGHFLDSHKDLGVDRVTIFRILNSFVESGLAKKVEFQEGKARYEKAGGDHHHFICEKCGSIEDVSDCHIDNLISDIQKKKGILIKRHSLEFFGLCKNCTL